MSLASKKLTPIPVGDGSGKFWEIKKQYGGMKQIIRRFKVEGGAMNIGENVETYVFDAYGTLDGFSTAPAAYVRTVPADERFADCYLETQNQDKGQGDGKETIVTKVYQEAYDTLREIEQPQEVTDENGRTSLQRTYVILNTAPEANYKFDPAAGPVSDVDDPGLKLYRQTRTIGNAVSVVQRNFIEVTDVPVQVGNDIVGWTDNGLKFVEQDFIVEAGYDISAFGIVGTTEGAAGEITGLILSNYSNASHDETAQTFRARWVEPGILSVSTPKVGGSLQVQVQAIGLSEAEVTAALAEVTANHKLIDVSIGNFQGFQTTNFTFEVDDFEVTEETETGLLRLERTQLSAVSFIRGDVGVDVYSGLILSGESIDNGNAIKKKVSRYAEPGILAAEKEFGRDGLLYVTFQSQGTKFTPTALNPAQALTDSPEIAFQGGPAADLFRDRVRNVEGFRIYVVTVMMLQNGDPLTPGDNEVQSYQRWATYTKPGILEITVLEGPVGFPGNSRWIKVQVQEYLSDDSTIDDTFKPYSIKEWASYNMVFIPEETGSPVVQSKGASGYLADSNGSGSGPQFWGIPVTSFSFNASSDPTPSVFYALANQCVGSDNEPAFTTDEGVKWYRKVKVTVVGTFGEYLNA